MSRFKVGDRVVTTHDICSTGGPSRAAVNTRVPAGSTGTVVYVTANYSSSGDLVAVQLDVYSHYLHTCGGLTPRGNGYNILSNYLQAGEKLVRTPNPPTRFAKFMQEKGL